MTTVLLAMAVLALDDGISRPDPGFDPFYAKQLKVRGIRILASERVSDSALLEAQRLAARMLERVSPQAVQALRDSGIRIAVISRHERTTEIPEYRDLYKAFPGTDWDARARGLGATEERPVISGAEENLLGSPGDRYRGESIFIHELAHTVADFGFARASKTFQETLDETYRAATKAGLWAKTYAASNSSEYWAEGVQSYFDCNARSVPPNGIHNHVGNRTELRRYDHQLFEFVDRSFGRNPWRWEGPARAQSGRR